MVNLGTQSRKVIIKAVRTANTPPKMGSKLAHFTCLCTKMVHDHFWKNTFLTHFWPFFGPKTARFQGILAPLEGPTGPPQAQNGLKTLEHPKWSWNNFGKPFFAPGPTMGARPGPPSSSTK